MIEDVHTYNTKSEKADQLFTFVCVLSFQSAPANVNQRCNSQAAPKSLLPTVFIL